jgi:hypothetical protein
MADGFITRDRDGAGQGFSLRVDDKLFHEVLGKSRKPERAFSKE